MEKVAKLEEIPDGDMKGVKAGNLLIALFRQGDKVWATDDICTHEGCIISEEHIMHGDEVECTCHGSHFNLKTGQNTVPPAAEPLRTFEVKIENGEVFVEV